MSKIRFTFASLAITALCGLSSVQAQQKIPVQPGTLGQPSQLGTRPIGTPTDQDGRYEARRVSSDHEGLSVKEAIVQKLKKANEAEIEIAKLAIAKSDNQQVKQFAQTIVQDHYPRARTGRG